MGLLQAARASVWNNPDAWTPRLMSAIMPTAAGVAVNEDNALSIAPVYECVRVLSESVASLPLRVYKRRPDRGRDVARDHALYSVLHDSPNPEMTAFQFRETLQGHLLTWGNAYANIVTDGGGRVRQLWPIPPNRVTPKRTDAGTLYYEVRVPRSGQPVAVKAADMMHLRGLSPDGVTGYSPVALLREELGLAAATRDFGARFFSNGARPGGVLEHPGQLSGEAADRLRGSWERMHQGLNNAHRIAILEEGLTYKQIGIAPDDAQFLQTRKFSKAEIAAIYRVPPHMIGDLERATFSNIEHQSIEFVMHSLRPWLVRWEQAIWLSLLVPSERKSYYAEHVIDALLRGDTKSRYEAYAVARQNGWYSANNIREKENENPIPDGDIYLVPLNMIPAGMAAQANSSDAGTNVEDPDAV